MQINEAEFVISNSDFRRCPQGDTTEVAFIGRSNVGKSSLINYLTGKKDLAKTSSKPGKTLLINHFLINKRFHIVDLPGYGFAKVSKTHREKLRKIIEDYIMFRPQLAGYRLGVYRVARTWRRTFLDSLHQDRQAISLTTDAEYRNLPY